MKTVYFIGGTMGVGKTSVGRCLTELLENSVFLDGDWCWTASPFRVTAETKRMVIQNICALLKNFIACTAYQNIIFCWVMHEQRIIDAILSELDLSGCRLVNVSLLCGREELIRRLQKDVAAGVRTEDVIARSCARLGMYEGLDTVKIDASCRSAEEIARAIAAL